MKSRPWLVIPVVAGFLAVGCQSGHTQNSQQPQVIVIPPGGEAPSPGMGAPPAGDSTPAMKAPVEEPRTGPNRLSYNSCNVDGPYIALTFDDGPHATLTPKLLDTLKEKGVKATFYVLGQCVAANPEVLQRAAAEGHEIGNHSYAHKAFTKAGVAGVASEVNQTNAVIENLTGKKPATLRPPYGSTNSAITKRLNEEFGLKVVMWDVDPLDWKYRSAPRVTSEILKNTKAGSIVLAHDIHPTTVAAMPDVIDGLQAKGFKFVTVSELIAMDRPQAVPAAAAPKPVL